MKKQEPVNKQTPKNHVVVPIHAYSDDNFVRMMSAMIGLDPKPSDGKKK